MATLEKPKIKKKKKTRVREDSSRDVTAKSIDICEEINEISTSDVDLSAISVESLPTLQKEEGAEVQEEIPKGLPEISDTVIITECSEIEESPKMVTEEAVITPSAPEMQIVPYLQNLNITREISSNLYPTLDTLKKEAMPLVKTKQESEINIEPFTTVQLRELYSNNLLSLAKDLETEFISNELNPSFIRNGDYLYNCLQDYHQCLAECRNLEFEIERLKATCKANEEKLWSIIDVNKTFSGMCSDGKRVSTTVRFQRAIFNDNAQEVVFGNFAEIRSTSCDKYVKSATLAALAKMKVIEEIYRIQNSHLNGCSSHREFVSGSENLQRSISILFFFLRKPWVDKMFVQNVKRWLTVLVNLLLDVATWPDHMFILHHVLRCPPGVVSWAAGMIEIPTGEFTLESLQHHLCVQHSLTVLQAILLPVVKRSEFLDEIMCWSRMDKTGSGGGGEWAFVDSDGEEDVDMLVLRENDLVAIFNQIPWKSLFCLATKTDPSAAGGLMVKKEALTAHSVLQFFAFSSSLIEILGMGLCTYNTEMFRQFGKRLTRLISHCVQYATNMYNIFQKTTIVHDVMVQARIQTEFEHLLLRGCDQIYISKAIGSWQYLVDFPFDQLSQKAIDMIYKKFRAPLFGDSSAEEVIEARNCEKDYSIVQVFEANDVSQEDLHYLLQALANMPNKKQSVLNDLLEIGFLRGSTKHTCSKISRDLIAKITEDCPELINEIIIQFKENSLEERSYGPYLLKNIPMEKWNPSPDVIDIIRKWLECSLESVENTMARIVINKFSWEHAHPAIQTGIALDIYRAAVKNSPSNFSLLADKSTMVNFQTWCWMMISILKLHAFDRENSRNVIYSPEQILPEIPELEALVEVEKGLSENRHLAIYLSILMTQRGHSIPQICTYSFRNMEILFKTNNQTTALRCLQLVFPLFLACPESLYNNPGFNSLLHEILAVDNTYTKMTMEMVFAKNVSSIIVLMGKMIISQFMDYQRFGLYSPTPLIMLWLDCLTRYKNYKTSWNALYILDVILGFAFTIPEAWFEVRKLFVTFTTEARVVSSVNRSSGSFLTKPPPLGLFPILPLTTVWLGLLVLEVEHDVFEVETDFWREFVNQLSLEASGQKHLDALVKKVAKSTSTTHSQFSDLVLVKLLQFTISCPTSHPVLVILCQRFFALYLTRVSVSNQGGGVSRKIYDASVASMKRLQGQLEFARDHYGEMVDCAKETDENLHQFHVNVKEMFDTFLIWLDGRKISMENVRMRLLLYNRNYWMEFINISSILKEHRQKYEEWNAKIGRKIPKEGTPITKSKSQDFSDQIRKQLSSYESPIARHSGERIQSTVNLSTPKEYFNRRFNTDFSLLEKYAKEYSQNINEMCCLDTDFGHLSQKKLVNEKEFSTEHLTCNSLLSNNKCSGAAFVRITENRVITKTNIVDKINQNREKHELIQEMTMKNLPEELLQAILRIEEILKILADTCAHQHQERKCSDTCKMSLDIFYKTLKASPLFLTHYPPSRSLTLSVIEAQKLIMPWHLPEEGRKLVEYMLRGSTFTNLLIDLFTPEQLPNREFLRVYEYIITSFGNCSDKELIGTILKRFLVSKWLEVRNPNEFVRNEFIQLVLRGLKVSAYFSSSLNEKILSTHLVQLFTHQFPQSYNSVLKSVFEGFIKHNLSGGILLDLLNAQFRLAGLEMAKDGIEKFAKEQKKLNHQDLAEIIQWLGQFYLQNRLSDSTYGLFVRFRNHSNNFNIMMITLLQAVTMTTITQTSGASPDEAINWIWSCVRDLYAMWLAPISLDTQSPPNWLKARPSDSSNILLPWMASDIGQPKEFLSGFTRCIGFVMETMPNGQLILRQIFLWHEKHFINPTIPTYINLLIHEAFRKLPWESFDPNIEILTASSQIFGKQSSEASKIFITEVLQKVSWAAWWQRHQSCWTFSDKCDTISLLFSLFIPMAAFGDKMTPVLEEVTAYFPWDLVDNNTFSKVLSDFPQVAGAAWCRKLKAPSPTNVEQGVWKLLREVSTIDLVGDDVKSSRAGAKRILYAKTILQFLLKAVSTSKEYFTAPEGEKIFQRIIRDLLMDVQRLLDRDADFPKEGLNILLELVREIPTEADALTSKLLTEAFISWEKENTTGQAALLQAVVMSRKGTELNVALLEVTIEESFKNPTFNLNSGWKGILEMVWDYMTILRPALIGQDDLLCLHLWAAIGLKCERDGRKRLSLMGVIFERLNNAKLTEECEVKVVLLWAFLCVVGFRESNQSSENSVFLIHVTKRLIHLANEPDNWGTSVLNAIGLTKLKKSKILLKCLACYMTELLKIVHIECDLERERCALNIELQSKQFTPYREAISQIHQHMQSDLSQQATHIASTLRNFYYTEAILKDIEILWS
ncbi:hypothetical protein DMENIID0001_072740 [Sergentomyia squamirostris]